MLPDAVYGKGALKECVKEREVGMGYRERNLTKKIQRGKLLLIRKHGHDSLFAPTRVRAKPLKHLSTLNLSALITQTYTC